MRHFFMGGDRWGDRVIPGSHLGQNLTNTQLVQILKAAVDKQAALKARNAQLPADFQLDDEKDILPVDQAISDQSSWITSYDNEIMPKALFWNQPADPKQLNAAITVQNLVNALDARERDQERKAQSISTNPQAPGAPSQVPSTPSTKSSVSGAVLAAAAVAAFATAVFISTDSWKSWPWLKSPYGAPPAP